MNWYVADKEYINYLKKYDSRVGHVEYVTQLKYNEVGNFRSFENEQEKTNYIYLLQKEKKIIDNLESVLTEKARKLYHKCQGNPDGKLSQRCCNFTLLEEKSKEYKKNEEQKNDRQ